MKTLSKEIQHGFTIPELMTGLVVAGVVVAAGLSLSSMIHRTGREDLLSLSETAKTDIALDQIVDEINQSQKILTSSSQLPAGCTAGGGTMFLAFQLPAQAYGKGDYESQNTSNGVKTIAEQNTPLCPVVVGLKNPGNSERGPRVLYRYGPGIDSKGFYQPTSAIPLGSVPLLDGIDSQVSSTAKSCGSGWSRLSLEGLEACIDRYRKTVQMSVSKVIPTAAGGTVRYTKRSAAGSARSLDSALIPVADSSSGGTGLGGSTCYLGQCGTCDGTTFLIDNSGSMGYARMEKAKNELLAAVAKCGDGARINVFWFNSGYGRFSNQPVSLSTNSRAQINQFIRGIRAGGGTNPWGAMDMLMRDQSVKRVVVLTDGGTNTSGNCITGGTRAYADCYANYNASNRSSNPVKIDAVALDTSCNYWLGPLAIKNGGSCVTATS